MDVVELLVLLEPLDVEVAAGPAAELADVLAAGVDDEALSLEPLQPASSAASTIAGASERHTDRVRCIGPLYESRLCAARAMTGPGVNQPFDGRAQVARRAFAWHG